MFEWIEDKDDWRLWWAADMLGNTTGRRLATQYDTPKAAGLLDSSGALREPSWPEQWTAGGKTPAEARKRLNAVAQLMRDRRAEAGTVHAARARDIVPESVAKELRTPFISLVGDAGALREAAESAAPRVAVVGTRRITERETRWMTTWLTEALNGTAAIVISGGAYGVDTVAHSAALRAGCMTWSVLAGGLLKPGPSGNLRLFKEIVQSGGALISERPPHAVPARYEFLERNRVVVALADLVVVMRAPARSGAMQTARRAFESGVPVFVLPGDCDAENARGSNGLLRAGATPLVEPGHLREQLLAPGGQPVGTRLLPGLEPPDDVPARSGFRDRATASPQAKSADATTSHAMNMLREEHPTIASLLSDGPMLRDELIRGGADPGTVDAELLDAELAGCIERHPGGRWSVAKG